MKEELFRDRRWNEYQDVEILKTKVQVNAKDKENVKKFRDFINNKIENEKSAKRN